ncbi:MAG TPA: chemotaxis protein CheB [Chryseolinea sp.]|nr:chemotaxis protein CheB [Chryseolinea sp.]
MKKKAAAKRIPKTKAKPFPIVAIGASAGGVEAITELVKNLRNDTGMAFVYVQHLDPTHKSMLADILSRVTKMPVQDARQRMPLAPNHIYIIPPNKDLIIVDGVLKLNIRRPKPAVNMPIDKLFRSLAKVHKEAAIGIVLSGNANDGTLGLKEIKNNGGLTFAQDASAKFESMPKSAIAEGCVDMVLSPKQIAIELGRISKNTDFISQALTKDGEGESDLPSKELEAVIELLKKAADVDFRHYKPNTVKRRIMRRMLLHKLHSLQDYTQYIKQHSGEIQALLQDLLINVTSFFRDPDTLEYLKKAILPKLLKGKTNADPLRIWIPACSTGEEVYSLAIIINEIVADKSLSVPVQIFASDLSEPAISKARIGLYSRSDVAEVSSRRLQRYFTKIDGSYRINKSIRDGCVFAPHNVLSDPPFSRLDLVSCCNLMIYLSPILQKKLLATFHYALKSNGYLVLGKSETPGGSASLFSQVEKKFKVFAKKSDVPNKVKFEMSYRAPEVEKRGSTVTARVSAKVVTREVDFERRVEELLLAKYVAASVVVSKDLDIIQFHGPISSFIEISSGKATLNLLKLVRPSLVFDLRSTVHKATKSNKPEKKAGLELRQNGQVTNISVEVIPLGKENEEIAFLIVFEKLPLASNEELRQSSFSKDQLVKRLQTELEATKEDIRSILEEQEASNEELQSANEEIVSSNEELQSINEELETSKEEVESSNEELMTINSELQVRNEQLAEAHEYSEAVAETIREAVLILDKDFRVRSANKSFYRIFRTKEEETEGMLIYELGNRQWDILELRQLLEDILVKQSVINGFEVSHDFLSIGSKVMLLHARTITQKVVQKQLIILAIEDITDHRMAERAAREKELLFRNMANNAPCMIWTAGPDKGRNFFNQTWFDFSGVKARPATKVSWQGTLHPADAKRYLDHFDQAFKTRNPVSIEYRMKRSDGEYRWVTDSAKAYYKDDGTFLGFIGTSTEMHDKKLMLDELDTKVKERTDELRAINHELQRSNGELQQFAYAASHDLQEPLRKILTYIDRIKHAEPNLSTLTSGHFEKVVESTGRMAKLIDDLLDFSMLSNAERRFVKVDLNRVVRDVFSDLEVTISNKEAELIFRGELPVIQAEAVQMSQLFSNLIGNALKFSREGVPSRITITSRKLPSSEIAQYESLDGRGPYFEIRVSDNGIGFNEEFAEEIFVIFQRLHEKKKFPGTGIGLALCRRIVNNHKGIIYAKRTADGADFIVILPQKQSASEQQNNVKS